MTERTEKVSNLIKEIVAQYLQREGNGTSLITVTRADCSPDMKKATVFVTVLPLEKEKQALEFAKRNRRDMREFLKKNMSTKVIPFLNIEIDKGEKHRQRIDELLREQ